MDWIKYVLIPVLTGLTALLSHMAVAVFHDGIRPIMPEYVEGRMKRTELSSIAFGLSIGFIASVGFAMSVANNFILNPWLLFLPTDILGVISPKKWLAALLGALWGVLVVTSFSALQAVFSALPIDFMGALGELSTPILTAFALFPVVAVFMQFGWQKGVIAACVSLLVRLLIARFTTLFPESFQLAAGVITLIIFAISADAKVKDRQVDADEQSVFLERTKRIQKHWPWFAVVGALIAVACNMGIFAGSEISIPLLGKVMGSTDTAAVQSAMQQAAVGDFLRGLGFVPLIATTALATGVFGVVGLTFVYPIGYLMPNPILAAIAGAAMIVAEVFLLGLIGRALERFPSMRKASDSIRSSISTVMEFALLLGSMLAVMKMGGGTGLAIGALLYFINDAVGKPVMRLAIGPVAAIATGIILNLLYFVGLFKIA